MTKESERVREYDAQGFALRERIRWCLLVLNSASYAASYRCLKPSELDAQSESNSFSSSTFGGSTFDCTAGCPPHSSRRLTNQMGPEEGITKRRSRTMQMHYR